MTFVKFLVFAVFLVAATRANFWDDDDDDWPAFQEPAWKPWPGFPFRHEFRRSTMPSFPKMPKIPPVVIPEIPPVVIPEIPPVVIPEIPPVVIPEIPPVVIPKIPPVHIPPITAPTFNFTNSGNVSQIQLSSSNINGISTFSSSETSTDENGNTVTHGGTTIITNENGVIKKYQFGDRPPDVKVNAPVVIVQNEFPADNMRRHNFLKHKPKRHGFEMHEMDFKMPEFKMPEFPKIPEIKTQDIKAYKPKPGETFTASSMSSSSYSNNINGKKKSGGEILSVVNDNGVVKEMKKKW